MHFAARAGRTEIVQLLIDNGADWNIVGDQGSVRQIAESYHHKAILDIIPASGAPKTVRKYICGRYYETKK